MTSCCAILNVKFPFSHHWDDIVIVMLFLHSYHFFSLNVCVSLEKFPHEYERNPRHSSFVGTPSAQLLACIGQALPLPVHLTMYRLWWHRSKPFLGYFSVYGTCILGLYGFILFIYIFLAIWTFMGISSLHRFFLVEGGGGGESKPWNYWKSNLKTGSKLENYRLFACIH